jgi:hypothetical protein
MKGCMIEIESNFTSETKLFKTTLEEEEAIGAKEKP